jgi:hypothetical protein
MAASATSETYDALWTLTMRARRKRLTDTIFDEYPGVAWFKSNALETEVGGKEIQEDIEYAKQDAEWFSRNQVLNTDLIDHVTAVFYPWRYIAVPISIAIDEENENRKAAGAMKLLASRTANSMKSIRDAVSVTLFGAQTGKTMLGLQDIIAADPTTGSLGGLTRVGNSFWQNKFYSTSLDWNSVSSNIVAGIERWNLQYNESASGNDTIKVIFCTETTYGEYQTTMSGQGYMRTTAANTKGVNHTAPGFNGATVIFDRDMPSGFAFGVNPSYTKLKIQTGLNFAKTPFRSPHNQLTKVGFIIVSLQLVTNNPRRNFVTSTIT